MVAQHQVAARRQGRPQFRLALHPPPVELETAAAQEIYDQQGIVLVVFHQHQADGLHRVHRLFPAIPQPSTGGRFSISQYRPSCPAARTNSSKSTGLRT